MTDLPPATVGSSLHERLIEDMTVRGFTGKTRKDYVGTVAGFADFQRLLKPYSVSAGRMPPVLRNPLAPRPLVVGRRLVGKDVPKLGDALAFHHRKVC